MKINSFRMDGPFARGLTWHPMAILLLLTCLATLIYSNTFTASFQLDDGTTILNNSQIKRLANFWDVSIVRYVGLFSFALNYRIGGLNVVGYHLVNLLIHITNGFLVYTLVSLLLRTPRMLADHSVQVSQQTRGVALAAALLFVAHPIQTQAVTYIVQRFTSLTALFYLLAVVCYLNWRLTEPTTRSRYRWYVGAFLATILAMKTKEISFTLPFMLLLVEGACFRTGIWRRWAPLIPFLLTLPIIPLSFSGNMADAEIGFARETTQISRLSYLFTQFRVMITYLRLLVLPIHQNLDYDYSVYDSFLDPYVFMSFLFLFGMLSLSLYLLVSSPRWRPVGFGLQWFFLTLMVESSVIPIRDVIFEHRLYLPSVGILLAGSIIIVGLSDRIRLISVIPVGVIVALLSVATYQRNLVWKDNLTLWSHVVTESPKKARAHNNLGNAYLQRDRIDEAMKEYVATIHIQPDFFMAHNNLGIALLQRGLVEEATKEFIREVQLHSNSPEAHINLGNIYMEQGRLAEAIKEHELAAELKPDDPQAHYGLGSAYTRHSQLDEAIKEYRAALQLNPDFADAHNGLGYVYVQREHLADAVTEFLAALQLKSNFPGAHNNLGNVYLRQGKVEEAIREFMTALELQPNYPEAHNNLGNAYARQKRWDEAIKEFLSAIQLAPDTATAHYYLGNIYADQGHLEEAMKEFSIALKLDPLSPDAHNNLGNVYARQGEFDRAIKEFSTAIHLAPNAPDAHYNLGSAYAHQRRLDEAIEEYLRAVDLKPNFVEAHYDLGNAYTLKGLKDEARKHFEVALKLRSDFIPAQQAIESLHLQSRTLP